MEIVGVVSDVKHFTLDAPATADLYVPLPQMPSSQSAFLAARMFWVIRAHGDASKLLPAIREAVLQVDPGVATSARTLATVLSSSLGARKMDAWLLGLFGQIAMVLSAIGVYGVVAFSVRARHRELAIRGALGARKRDLSALIVRDEPPAVAAGIVTGLVIAYLGAPHFFGSPFETNSRDLAVYLAVAGVLLMTTAGATFVPVRIAGATDPAEALRLS